MKFKDLYINTKKVVNDTLNSMWCADINNNKENPQIKAQAKLISKKIDEIFAPANAMPVVQYMERYVSTDDDAAANQLVLDENGNSLWRKIQEEDKYHSPYMHQHECWKELNKNVTLADGSEAKKSIVVTTGTGSGKTECFMLPLVSDLLRNNKANEHGVKAIFLYPLNALMEDQKDRMQELLKDTNLRFCVYNGNLPEEENEFNYEAIEEEILKYPNINPTRKALRGHKDEVKDSEDRLLQYKNKYCKHIWEKADIIFTNPTMLEYMLLRSEDQALISQSDLRWIVIDETHTYTGASATELAMQMRRILLAFKKTPNNIRFATSSATIGNGNDISQVSKNEEKLKEFIQGISGQCADQIKIIKGKRKSPFEDEDIQQRTRNNEKLKKVYEILYEKEYVSLDELDCIYTTSPTSIEDRLDRLDVLCDEGLTVKVHFFNRVLTNGIRVKLNSYDERKGTFNLYTEENTNDDTPYLELRRCSHCGGYFAVGESHEDGVRYRRSTISDDDIFDFEEKDFGWKPFIVGLLNDYNGKNTPQPIKIKKDCPNEFSRDNSPFPGNGEYITAIKGDCCCPYCRTSLKSKKESTSDNDEEFETKKMTSFRVSTDFISRIIASPVLNEMKPIDEEDKRKIKEKERNIEIIPHKGQQYISFVDSRQAAAKATLNQLKEQEKLWVYSRIFHKLCQKANDSNEKQKFVTWDNIFDLLFNDPICDVLCFQSIDRSKDSEEMMDNDKVKNSTKDKYVLSLMYDLLAKRPVSANSPENMGLFVSHYPLLDKIEKFPKGISSLDEWKNLLKIYLDRYIRANEMFFLLYDKTTGGQTNYYDDSTCKRFATEKHNVRPAHKSFSDDDKKTTIEDYLRDAKNYNVITKLIAGCLLDKDDSITNNTVRDVLHSGKKEELVSIHNELWNTLCGIRLIENSQYYGKDKHLKDRYENTKDEISDELIAGCLNLKNLSFKLFDNVYFCNTSRLKNQFIYRPYDVTFNGYAPFATGEGIVKVNDDAKEEWGVVYPYIKGRNDNEQVTSDKVTEWLENNRKLLYKYSLMGEFGAFSNRIEAIYRYPDIFVQAEHTAQIDKIVSRQSQEMFKDHEINILACSTTMEMGVDLGSLELVMMNSIPPHPSNFKQRAGRSGRSGQNRSASITLCSSDSIGLRTMINPIHEIILRKTEIPFVDWTSKPIIQRHFNAFMLREFLLNNYNDNTATSKVIDFFADNASDPNIKYKVNNKYPVRDKSYPRVIKLENNNNDPDYNGSIVYPDFVYPGSYETNCGKSLIESDNNKYNKFLNSIDELFKAKHGEIKLLLKQATDFSADEAKTQLDETLKVLYKTLTDRISTITQIYKDYNENKRGSNKNIKAINAIQIKFAEILGQSLIELFAKNRVTPNANMPVDVVEFAIHDNYTKRNNPSYQLRSALSQYAPGNSIVISNTVKIVRGVRYTGQYREANTLKYIYTDGVNVKVGPTAKNHFGNSAKKWSVNNRKELLLIQPYEFIPSVDEDTRVMQSNEYSRVDAQLVGAESWMKDTDHCYRTRVSSESLGSNILYYNVGKGFGYCICKKCGKTAVEQKVCDNPQTPNVDLPSEMNDVYKKVKGQIVKDEEGTKEKTHYHLLKKDVYCDIQDFYRNAIIGDLITTDYTEIAIMTETGWIESKLGNEPLLITLGIAFTKMLTEYLGKEYRDVDFFVMPNGHICVFDTNPGGSGYSNKLGGNNSIIDIIIDKCEEFLSQASSKDEILDKYTLRYIDNIDIKAALDWIHYEQEQRENAPLFVTQIYNNAHKAKYSAFKEDICSRNPTLFFSADASTWCYSETLYNPNSEAGQPEEVDSNDWLNCFVKPKTDNPKRYKTIFVSNNNQKPVFERPIYRKLQTIDSWSNVNWVKNPMSEGFYPIAIANDKLYFTDRLEYASLNNDWATEARLYYIPMPDANITIQENRLDVNPETPQNTTKFEIAANASRKITSVQLAEVVYEADSIGKETIDRFIDHCRNSDGKLSIIYKDQYLRSGMGIVTSIQFINWFVEQIGKPFSLEIQTEEYEETSRNDKISFNLDFHNRNEFMDYIILEWRDKLPREREMTKQTVLTKRQKEMPHWRVLSLTCGDKQLEIYPNGGIINEWYLDKHNNGTAALENNRDLHWDTPIPLYHKAPIMYDIVLKE